MFLIDSFAPHSFMSRHCTMCVPTKTILIEIVVLIKKSQGMNPKSTRRKNDGRGREANEYEGEKNCRKTLNLRIMRLIKLFHISGMC